MDVSLEQAVLGVDYTPTSASWLTGAFLVHVNGVIPVPGKNLYPFTANEAKNESCYEVWNILIPSINDQE